ncbi:6597_t:CDS:2 [Cetraspora pellucida]|uniref:6597_t:CDS:1 n=1 Tax=Cetraspora pellucida TaxID=1433469 RepID=A0A9N9B6H8_9GLOM|nr:6597_t:CDS:2 [Cetraspora pellucida]
MRGYDLDNQFCRILDPSRPFNKYIGVNPLVFNNSTQKIAIALWSDEETNNTKLNITQDRWFTYGIFTEYEDPKYAKFQIVKMPSLSYLYVTRIEIYDVAKADAIIGSRTGQKSDTIVKYDKMFTSFNIAGFAISNHLWELFRIIPANYVNNTRINSQEYPVQLWYCRVEFTLLQLAANMGGFLSALSVIYFTLFGSRKMNPWGIIQRYILKTVPSISESYFSMTESHLACSDIEANNNDIERKQIYSRRNSVETNSESSLSSFEQTLIADIDESKIQTIRYELHAEMQRIIKKELLTFRRFLGKYYLKNI